MSTKANIIRNTFGSMHKVPASLMKGSTVRVPPKLPETLSPSMRVHLAAQHVSFTCQKSKQKSTKFEIVGTLDGHTVVVYRK